jgi:diguanylate cyclase (GGDEF)-like protein
MKIGESIHSVVELRNYDFSSNQSVFESNGKTLSLKVNKIKNNRVRIYVVNDITESERVKKQLEVLATEDALTGLYNRRHFMETLEGRARKGVFVMIDIDLFKTINDTFGHVEGDKVLSYFGKEIQKFFHDQIACRYGGEEFALFIEGADAKKAYRLVEDMRSEMNDTDGSIKITFSAGLAEYRAGNIMKALIDADQKLYEAKENGRNQTRY